MTTDPLQDVRISLVGFRGGHFSGFYARTDSSRGPGWYVFGSNPAYGGRYPICTARPDVKPRRHRSYNGLVAPGWRTKREAMAVAAVMNARDADCLGVVHTLPLDGTRSN